MKCTLPEPSEYPSREETDDTIRELWKVLRLVEEMRDAQKIADRAMAEADDYSEALICINKAEELEKEIDEWFNDLRKEQ